MFHCLCTVLVMCESPVLLKKYLVSQIFQLFQNSCAIGISRKDDVQWCQEHDHLLQLLWPRTLLPRWWSQAQCPVDLRSLPRLKDAAAAFPFVGSTSNEVEHVSQRDTDRHAHTSTYIHRGHWDTQTHTGGWHGPLHRLSQTRCCLQQQPHTGLT